jgi:hypothetical protein
LILADPIFNSSDDRARGVAVTASAVADTRGLGLQSAVNDVAGQEAGATVAAATTTMQGLPLARLSGTRTEADQISSSPASEARQKFGST